jgi:hypothetical protein
MPIMVDRQIIDGAGDPQAQNSSRATFSKNILNSYAASVQNHPFFLAAHKDKNSQKKS